MDINDPRRKNLVPNSQLTPKQRQERASKAGKASVRAKREHKAMRETLLELLSLPMKRGDMASELSSAEDYKGANVSLRERMMIALVSKAIKGDVKAAEFVRDTIGEAPVQEVKVDHGEVCEKTEEELRKIANGEV